MYENRIAVQVEHQRNPGDTYSIRDKSRPQRSMYELNVRRCGETSGGRVFIPCDYETPASEIAAYVKEAFEFADQKD